jgi:ABC-type glycerol-3-phosphate transport system permease component
MYLIIGVLGPIGDVFPFYWMIITSLKTNEEVIQPTQTFFPSIVMWSNYVYVFQAFKFLDLSHGTRSWWLSSRLWAP